VILFGNAPIRSVAKKQWDGQQQFLEIVKTKVPKAKIEMETFIIVLNATINWNDIIPDAIAELKLVEA